MRVVSQRAPRVAQWVDAFPWRVQYDPAEQSQRSHGRDQQHEIPVVTDGREGPEDS